MTHHHNESNDRPVHDHHHCNHHISDQSHDHQSHDHQSHDHQSHDHQSHDHQSHDHQSHDHQSHDHHSNHHSETPMSLNDKLVILLKHWIDHNNSHKENYLSWADKAGTANFAETAELLKQTAELSDKITNNLENALKSIYKSY